MQELINRINELEEAIKWVVTQKADDLCWMDAYVRLGKLVGIEITLEQLSFLPEQKMLDNCKHYIRHLHTGCGYKPTGLAEDNENLRKELAVLKNGA